MNYPTIDNLQQIIAHAHNQVVTALWISASMITALLSFICISLNFKRTALCFALIYSAILCMIKSGFSDLIGPLGCITATIGLIFSINKKR